MRALSEIEIKCKRERERERSVAALVLQQYEILVLAAAVMFVYRVMVVRSAGIVCVCEHHRLAQGESRHHRPRGKCQHVARNRKIVDAVSRKSVSYSSSILIL